MFCERCGAPIDPGASFCARCGAPAARSVTPPTPTPPAFGVPPATPPGIPPAGYAPAPAPRGRAGMPVKIVAVILVVVVAVGALAAVFLLGGLGGAGSLVQGRWVRSSSCGVTWSLEFQAFGSLRSVEYTYDGSCFLLTAEPDSGSWSSEDAGDHVYAYFWDVYRATVYKSTPNEMTVHKFDYQGSAIGSWSFVRP